ncbi:MAG: glycosyltransferase [bacterium]|nr:glycosyltransferase [bacterium]
MNKKILICGAFGTGSGIIGGQVIKTRLFDETISKQLPRSEILRVDSNGWKRHPFRLYRELRDAFKQSSRVFLLPGINGLRVFLPLLLRWNRKDNKDIRYIVIGGWLPELLARSSSLLRRCGRLSGIYVETMIMKERLEELGLRNVGCLPNFREYSFVPKIKKTGKPVKAIFFSRVSKDKGVELACAAVSALNAKTGTAAVSLDIYGPVEKEYEPAFTALNKKFPSYICYKGIATEGIYEMLSGYDLMLFPTFYEGEGFPGVLIEAFIAGVPVLASDWKYNRELVKEGETGFLCEANSLESLAERLGAVAANTGELDRMKKKCVKEAEKFRAETVVGRFLEEIGTLRVEERYASSLHAVFTKLLLLMRTVRYLKLRQILYRVYYAIAKRTVPFFGARYTVPKAGSVQGRLLTLKDANSVKAWSSVIKEAAGTGFTFLNRFKSFEGHIDWNYPEYGKLWVYNLNYFDYLNREDLPVEQGLALIRSFVKTIAYNHEGMEPYPLSLRGINWIRFLARNGITDPGIDAALYGQYRFLCKNPEYHLMGNHLLENGLSLLYGAYYFNDPRFYKKAAAIIKTQLEEQVLPDGANFELSPMYHQVILFRLLGCIDLMGNNRIERGPEQDPLLNLLREKAGLMLQWLREMTFANGSIPLFSDSAFGIAPTTKEINLYARELKISCPENSPGLKDSGYRRIRGKSYDMLIDIGQIGPDYIPGHGHCDIFNFELYINNSPFIVDSGTSTYEINSRRQEERSTGSHNTVQVEDFEQSEVWSAFRVGRRARVVNLRETNTGMETHIEAAHTGYKKKGALHSRRFEFGEEEIVIVDTISMKNPRNEYNSFANLHFYPGLEPVITANEIRVGSVVITMTGAEDITLDDYMYAPEFNKLVAAKVVRVRFRGKLATLII